MGATVKLSVIDLGTNTILMVTAEIGADGSIHLLGDEHEIARLGRGVDATRRIMPESFDRVESFLLRYRQISSDLGAERIVAFGTSALRDAANREEFIDEMDHRTSIRIEVISGAEEAELTFAGAMFGLEIDQARRVVIDIGGGSTEIAVGTTQALEQSRSVDIGAVRITERYLGTLPPSADSLAAARQEIAGELADLFELEGEPAALGVAGTVTTLGAIDAGIESFSAEALDGWRLSREAIEEQVARIASLTLEEIGMIPQIPTARADVILGGALILEEFMRRYSLPEIIVSTRGLRYGILMREAHAAMVAEPGTLSGAIPTAPSGLR